ERVGNSSKRVLPTTSEVEVSHESFELKQARTRDKEHLSKLKKSTESNMKKYLKSHVLTMKEEMVLVNNMLPLI
nr:hypothetical protein [Tanacetum cinerariifolium]